MKRLLAAGLVLAGAVLAAVAGLQSDAFDAALARNAPAVAQRFGVGLALDRVDFDLRGPSLAVWGLRAAHDDGSWKAEARWASVRFHPLRSLSGSPHFSLGADGVRVDASPDLTKKSKFELPDVVLDAARVTDAALAIALPARGLAVEVPRIEVQWVGGRGWARAAGGGLAWHGGRESLRELRFEGSRRLGVLKVDRLALLTERVSASVAGRMGLKHVLEGEAQVRLDVRRLPEAWIDAVGLRRYRPIEGVLTVAGRVGGRAEEPTFDGRAWLGAGRFQSLAFEGASTRLRADLGGLEFRELEARTAAGGARAFEGRLAWKEGVTLEAKGRAERYDLRRFIALFVDGYFPVGLLASGEVTAKGSLYPELALRCGVDATASDLDVTTREGEVPTTWFALPSGTVSSECVVRLDDLVFGPTRVETGSVSVRIPKGRVEYVKGLQLDTEVEIRDLDLVRQYLPEGTDVRGRAVGHFGGPYHALTFRYALDLASAALWGKHLGTLTADAEFDLLDLKVRNGRLLGPLGRIEADGVARLRRGGSLDLTADWSEGDLAAAGGLLRHLTERVPADLGGMVSAVGHVGGTLEAPSFEGGAAVVEGRGWSYSVEEARVNGVFGVGRWEAKHVVARAYGADVEGAGSGDRDFFEASGTLQSVSAAGLEPALGRRLPVDGALSGRFRLWGAYERPTVTLEGAVVAAAVGEARLGDVEVRAELQGRQVRAELSAFGGAALAKANASFEGDKPFSVTLEAQRVPWRVVPTRLVPPGLAADEVTGRGSLTGVAAARTPVQGASWEGAVTGVRYGELAVGEVRHRAALEDRTLRFGLTAWGGEAAVEGATTLGGAARLELAARAVKLDVARFAALAAFPRGRVSATARGLLDLEAFGRLSGTERLRALSGVEAEGTAEGLVAPGWVALPDLAFELGTGQGRLRAAVSGAGLLARASLVDAARLAWTAEVGLDRFALGPLVPEGHALAGLSGEVSGELRGRGSGRRVEQADGSGQAVDLAWSKLAPSRWQWRVGARDGAATFEAAEPRGVRVEGLWSASGGVHVAGVLDDVPLEGWLRDADVPSDFSGRASGTAELSWRASDGVTAELRLRRLAATLPPVAVANQGDVLVTYGKAGVRFESARLVGEGFDLRLAGGFVPGRSWDLTAKGRGDLAVLGHGVPQVRSASGTAVVELSLKGPWAEPALEGPVEILAGSQLALDALDYAFEDLDARGFLEANRGLVLEWMDAQFGEGRVHVEGFVGARGVRPRDLRLLVEVRDVAYERPRQVSYRFDGDLLLTGRVERPEVRGEVRLEQFLYGRRLNWKTMAFDALQRRPLEVGSAGAPVVASGSPARGAGRPGAEGVFVDVSLQGRQDLRVENNLGDVSLAVDLRARGLLPRPALWGRVEMLDGTLRFRSQEYTVLQSAVEFLGETQPVPLLDLHARTTAAQYAVTVDVTGPLDSYQVLLSSSPPLSQTDLVALLTLGTTSDQVQGPDAITAAEAASFLTGRIQDLLETEVGELLGFDQFSIDTSYSSTSQSSMPRVTVGKAITQALFAKYSAAVGDESTQDFQVQYTLNPRVQLLGSWSDRGPAAKGSVGGEVRLRFTFR